MSDVKLYPGWKEAARQLIEDGLTYGSSIAKSRMIELCEITPAKSIDDMQRFNLEVLAAITAIKDTLLTRNRMLLVSDRNGGYFVIDPKSQTDYAVDQGRKALKSAMETMRERAECVNTDMLTLEEKKHNADALAKMSMLAGMVKKETQQIKDSALRLG